MFQKIRVLNKTIGSSSKRFHSLNLSYIMDDLMLNGEFLIVKFPMDPLINP